MLLAFRSSKKCNTFTLHLYGNDVCSLNYNALQVHAKQCTDNNELSS